MKYKSFRMGPTDPITEPSDAYYLRQKQTPKAYGDVKYPGEDGDFTISPDAHIKESAEVWFEVLDTIRQKYPESNMDSLRAYVESRGKSPSEAYQIVYTYYYENKVLEEADLDDGKMRKLGLLDI